MRSYSTKRASGVWNGLYLLRLTKIADASETGKLLAAIKSPFEVKFKEVVDEVEWLINMVEKEALAMGLASMERQFSGMNLSPQDLLETKTNTFSALAEWGLAVDCEHIQHQCFVPLS
jgi:hypothetical protein